MAGTWPAGIRGQRADAGRDHFLLCRLRSRQALRPAGHSRPDAAGRSCFWDLPRGRPRAPAVAGQRTRRLAGRAVVPGRTWAFRVWRCLPWECGAWELRSWLAGSRLEPATAWRPAPTFSTAHLIRSIGNRRTIGSVRRRRSRRTTRSATLGTTGSKSCPAGVPGSSLAPWGERRNGRAPGLAGRVSGRSRCFWRWSEWRIPPAAGAGRPGRAAGLPTRESPGRGSLALAGSSPCAGSSSRPRSTTSTRPRSTTSIRPSSTARIRPRCGAQIRRCVVRSGIRPGGSTAGHKRRPRASCGTRLASVFLRPARSTRRWPGCGLALLPWRLALEAGAGWALPPPSGSWLGGRWSRRRTRCGPPFGSWFGCRPSFGPAENGSGCRRGWGRRGRGRKRASRCLDLSRPGSLHGQGRVGSHCFRRGRGGSHLRELRQAVFQEVVSLRVHGERMNLASGRQAAHRFPYPRARGHGREKDLDLFARSRVHRLQVHGDQQRKSSYLGSGAGGLERPAVAHAQHLPACRLARVRQHRADAQRRQSSHKARSTAASVSSRPRVSRASAAVSAPSLSRSFHSSSTRGETLWPEDFCGACFQSGSARRASTKGRASRWARKSGCSPTTPSRFSGTTVPEAMRRVSSPCAWFDGGRTRRGLPAPYAGFDEGGRRRRQLRLPGQIKTQGMLCQPALRVIEGEDGALLLAPVRRPCCLELLCYQESLFSRVVIATRPHPFGAI